MWPEVAGGATRRQTVGVDSTDVSDLPTPKMSKVLALSPAAPKASSRSAHGKDAVALSRSRIGPACPHSRPLPPNAVRLDFGAFTTSLGDCGCLTKATLK